MDTVDDPLVQASHELYRRTRSLRRRLLAAAVLVVPGLTVSAAYLARTSSVLAMIAGGVAFGVGYAAHQFLTRWLPKHRAQKAWLNDIEETYGVPRAEVLKISLGLEYHDVRRIDGPVIP